MIKMNTTNQSRYPLNPSCVKFDQVLLYETSSFYYLIGSDLQETLFRVLKFDRRIVRPSSLSEILIEDPLTYTKEDLFDMLHMIHEGNKSSGGLVKVATACGVVGLVSFLDCYYLTLITQKRKVGSIGGNDIYTIKSTEVFAIKPREVTDSNTLTKIWRKLNQKLNQTSSEIAESRYMGLFQFIDLTKDFFFSYGYDLTNSLQYNFIMNNDARKSEESGRRSPKTPISSQTHDGVAKRKSVPEKKKSTGEDILGLHQELFIWNYYQIHELSTLLGKESASNWILPLIHGSCQQRRFSILGRLVDVILIARRSRHYAGTRYLKRGVNVHGKVANDCEIEQIIQVDSGAHAKFSSLLQMRGSIPTYWSQETSVTQPKPPIVVNRVDPTYLATQEHFADLIKRYNLPIIVLDLVKHEERRPREVIVGKEYRQALEIVNSSMPLARQIRYIALDYSKLSKNAKQGHISRTPVSNSSGLFPQLSSRDDKASDVNTLVSIPHTSSGQSGLSGVGRVVGREWALLVRQQKSQRGDIATAVNDSNTNRNMNTSSMKNATIDHGHISQPVSVIRVDLFAELENIAMFALSETAFFCSTTRYLDRIELLDPEIRRRSTMMGFMTQNGALRTNCIDCLDRTNGGQFALGMQHLTVGLQAIGVLDHTSLDPASKLFIELMEMYGDLGDRIAVQYGGSEAHNKMAGASASSNAAATNTSASGSTSKQGELLTSIKRYYSNAFTDMMKQDAMNVFLGCFVPQQQQVPLWDLDSDNELHNLLLHPPEPYVNKVLFNDMLTEIDILMNRPAAIDNNAEVKDKALQDCSVCLNDIDVQNAISRYFIKSIDASKNMINQGGFERYPSDTISSSTSSDIPNTVKYLINRSERRKVVAAMTKFKINEAIEHWWKEAQKAYPLSHLLDKYDPSFPTSNWVQMVSNAPNDAENNDGKVSTAAESMSNPVMDPLSLILESETEEKETEEIRNRSQRVRSFKLVRTIISQSPDDIIDDEDDYRYHETNPLRLSQRMSQHKANKSEISMMQMSPTNKSYSSNTTTGSSDVKDYFTREHHPEELTFFDELLSTDCYSTIDVIPDTMSSNYEDSDDDKATALVTNDGGIISRGLGGILGSNRSTSVSKGTTRGLGIAHMNRKKSLFPNDTSTEDLTLMDAMKQDRQHKKVDEKHSSNPYQTSNPSDMLPYDYYYNIINPFEVDSIAEDMASSNQFNPLTDMFAITSIPRTQDDSFNADRSRIYQASDIRSSDMNIPSDSNMTSGGIVGGVGRYVREIGMKARFFVGGLLVRKEGEDAPNHDDEDYSYNKDDITDLSGAMYREGNGKYPYTSSHISRPWERAISASDGGIHNNDPNESSAHKMFAKYTAPASSSSNMNIFKPVTPRTISQYASYAAQGLNPANLMVASVFPDPMADQVSSVSTQETDQDSSHVNRNAASRVTAMGRPAAETLTNSRGNKASSAIREKYEEFDNILHDFCGIDVDNVKGMEKLSRESYITSTLLVDNLYKDLSHLDSAALATEVLFSSLNFLESDLVDNIDELTDSSDVKVSATTIAPISEPQTQTNVNTNASSTSSKYGYGIHIGSLPLKSVLPIRKGLQLSLPTGTQSSTPNQSTTNTPSNGTRDIYAGAIVTSSGDISGRQSPTISTMTGSTQGTSAENNTNKSNDKTGSNSSMKGSSHCLDRALLIKPTTIEHISSYCKSMHIGSGLEHAILSSSHRYLFEQLLALRALDPMRLAKRMSSLTSVRSLIDYSSMFSQEAIAADLDLISFTTSDSPAFSSLPEISTMYESLKHIHKTQQEYKKSFSKRDNGETTQEKSMKSKRIADGKDSKRVASRTINDSNQSMIIKRYDPSALSIPVSVSMNNSVAVYRDDPDTNDLPDRQSYFYASPLDRPIEDREYDGFVLSSSDVYVSRVNPYLIMNEAAALKFSALMKKLHQLRYATAM